MASTIAAGSRRPRPATAQTGVLARLATAAKAVVPVAAMTRVASSASASASTMSEAAVAMAAASVGEALSTS